MGLPKTKTVIVDKRKILYYARSFSSVSQTSHTDWESTTGKTTRKTTDLELCENGLAVKRAGYIKTQLYSLTNQRYVWIMHIQIEPIPSYDVWSLYLTTNKHNVLVIIPPFLFLLHVHQDHTKKSTRFSHQKMLDILNSKFIQNKSPAGGIKL